MSSSVYCALPLAGAPVGSKSESSVSAISLLYLPVAGPTKLAKILDMYQINLRRYNIEEKMSVDEVYGE